jgi:cytochrome d ubiquinol oxidase subunit I
VKGLETVPRDLWPPVSVVHAGFDVMVGIGSLLALLGLISLLLMWRLPALLEHRRMLRVLVVALPLGFLALEAGWAVTEVGRQPWIVYGVLRTADAVTPMPGLVYPLMLFAAVYVLLSVLVTWLMTRQFRHVH